MTFEYMLKQFLAATGRPWMERHLTWLGALEIEQGVVPELACKLDHFPHDDPLNRVMWFDFLTYLPDDLLVKVDRQIGHKIEPHDPIERVMWFDFLTYL